MIAEKNIYLENASQAMYELSSNEQVQLQCRARRDYNKQLNTYNKAVRDLEEANHTIAQQDETIKQLQKRIAELESQQHD